MEPVTTLTATAIAHLAFQKFVESGAGELAKKFTTDVLTKMDSGISRKGAVVLGTLA